MAPFVSKAQKGYLTSNKPAIAKEFQAKTPPGAQLPNHLPAAQSAVSDLKKRKQ